MHVRCGDASSWHGSLEFLVNDVLGCSCFVFKVFLLGANYVHPRAAARGRGGELFVINYESERLQSM